MFKCSGHLKSNGPYEYNVVEVILMSLKLAPVYMIRPYKHLLRQQVVPATGQVVIKTNVNVARCHTYLHILT